MGDKSKQSGSWQSRSDSLNNASSLKLPQINNAFGRSLNQASNLKPTLPQGTTNSSASNSQKPSSTQPTNKK